VTLSTPFARVEVRPQPQVSQVCGSNSSEENYGNGPLFPSPRLAPIDKGQSPANRCAG
jgi:hypothetical protein